MALINKLEAIGDAIRAKTGKSDLLTLDEMVTEIGSIETGGGGGGDLPAEALEFTGDCSYAFAYGQWDWMLEDYANSLNFHDVSDLKSCFQKTKVESLPFDINVANKCTSFNSMFDNANNLKTLPNIQGTINYPTGNYSGILDIDNLFSNCWNLKEIPDSFFENMVGDPGFWETSYQYRGDRNNMFYCCYSLRKLPDTRKFKTTETSVYSHLYYGLNYLYTLDEITDLVVYDTSTFTSNAFNNTFSYCYRVKRLTFETNEDGSPKKVNWKNQKITLNNGFGHLPGTSPASDLNKMVFYNSGITEDKKVFDDESYQALKDDPDWFACHHPDKANYQYSRYNKLSAIETINTLPDTSEYLATAGGTNNIIFVSDAGSKTDGGAIGDLTEAEIAVAAAKGWTVTV